MSVVEVSDMLLQHSSWPGKMRLQEQATSIMICQHILHIFSIVMINVIVQYCMAVDCMTTIVVTTPTIPPLQALSLFLLKFVIAIEHYTQG